MERAKQKKWRPAIVHGLRVSLVIALLMAIPSPRPIPSEQSGPPTAAQLRSGGHQLPDGWQVGERDDSTGLWQLLDADGAAVGWLARTLPEAVDAVGYRGPSEASIVIAPNFEIVSIGLLGSEDTPEHVRAVREDRAFFQQFHGWVWDAPPRDVKVDRVSGATLTSLALAEGIIKRMGDSRPSLVFPDPITVDEIQVWYPDAVLVDDSDGRVYDQNQKLLGQILRTGPYRDDLIGYQGPTELLIRLDTRGGIEAIQVRRSFDNEPYVDYVRTEFGFWKLFTKLTIEQLAAFKPREAGVEGVSGATMTSQTVAETLAASAQAYVSQQARRNLPEVKQWSRIRWSSPDVATMVMLLAAALLSRLGIFRSRWPRRVWLLFVVVVIGFWAGNLVSLALIAGWSAEGIAWRLAPGLSAIALVAMVVPPMTKSNPYCNHLCPHGAIQQLIKPARLSRRRWKVNARLHQCFSLAPGGLLVLAYLGLLAIPTMDLSGWEPFHAYLFRLAPWGALVLAVASLLISASVPMAFCRWGCPTGRLIDYLRFSATSNRIRVADLVAGGLLVIALVVASR